MNNHTSSVSSEAALEDCVIGSLVAEYPGLSRVFQAHKIDFCCQGNRTVKQACHLKGLSLDSFVAQLQEGIAGQPESQDNPADLPTEDLVKYIVERHHGFLRNELPRLNAMAERVAQVHGHHTPSLVKVFVVFQEVAEELVMHIHKEEQVLFPMIVEMAEGGNCAMPIEGPIAAMMQEHDDAGAGLAQLSELTNSYQPPADACNTYRALFAGLADLEVDLHRHIHLENHVLFPAAKKLAGIQQVSV